MRIGIDIDDVLAQFNKQWLHYYNKTYGTNYQYEDMIDYDFSKVYTDATGEEIFNRVFDFYKSPEFDEVIPVEGSQDGVKAIQDHELFVITSRNEDLQAETLDWLSKYFHNSFDEVIFTNNFTQNVNHKARPKSEVGKELGLHYMVEDAIKVLLLDRPWNRNSTPHDNISKVQTWSDVVKLLETNT